MDINKIVNRSFASEGTEPVTLAEAKAHLNIPTGNTYFDTYITALITQARETAENFTGLSIVSKTVTVIIDLYSECMLPYNPVTTFTSASLKTGANAYTVQDLGNDFDIDGDYFIPIATLSGRWKLIYVAGYTPSTIPAGLKLGILQEIAFRFENRGDLTENRANVNPGISSAAEDLFTNYVQPEWVI